MKTHLLFIIILFGQTVSIAQSIEKNRVYSDTIGSYIHFQSDMLSYHFVFLTTPYITQSYGMGKYKIKKNKIIIYTEKYNWESVIKPIYKEKQADSNNISLSISVKDKESNNPIPFTNVWYKEEKEDKIQGGKQTDKNGIAELYIDKMPIDSFIYVSSGDHSITRIPIRCLKGSFEIFLEKGYTYFSENRKIRYYYLNENDTLIILFDIITNREFKQKKKKADKWDLKLIKQN